MELKNKITKRLEHFMDMVLHSIDAESKILDVVINDTKNNKIEALKLMIKMQDINMQRIKILQDYSNEFAKKMEKHNNKPQPKRIRKSKTDNISKQLIDKYEALASIEINKKIENIEDMFNG